MGKNDDDIAHREAVGQLLPAVQIVHKFHDCVPIWHGSRATGARDGSPRITSSKS